MTVPNPGSPEAVKGGCRCPQFDNHHGRGMGQTDEQGRPLFWINAECPLHAAVDDEDDDIKEA